MNNKIGKLRVVVYGLFVILVCVLLFPALRPKQIVDRFDKREILLWDLETEVHNEHRVSPDLNEAELVKSAIAKLLTNVHVSDHDKQLLREVKIVSVESHKIEVSLGPFTKNIEYR